MSKDSITIENIKIQYGITLVREILAHGYTISNFEQITDEPYLATCNLSKENKLIATLGFYHLADQITIEQLADIPVDYAFLHNTDILPDTHQNASNRTLRNRILWTFLIHLAAAAAFFCVFAVPALFAWVRNTDFRMGTGQAPMGIVLLILPALIITFMWGGFNLKQKPVVTKILLSLFLIINVIISVIYLVLIAIAFTHKR